MTATITLRASTKRVGLTYKGVIRHGDDILWLCAHSHNNRDITTKWSGDSARFCAERHLAQTHPHEEHR